MSWLLIVGVALLLLVVLGAIASKQASGSGKIGFPYQPARTLFSAAERSFLGVLDQAIGPDYRVFGKVRVADIATVERVQSVSTAKQSACRQPILTLGPIGPDAQLGYSPS